MEDDPEHADAMAWLAYALATAPQEDLRDGNRAVELAASACRISRNRDFQHLQALSAAYAETGQFPQAIRTADLEFRLASSLKDQRLMAIAQDQISRYRAGQPLRTP